MTKPPKQTSSEHTVVGSVEGLAAGNVPPAGGHSAAATDKKSSKPLEQSGSVVMAHGTPGALVGLQLNDLFEITRYIAQGGMGEVYEGRNIASNERVAIKVILPQFAADAQFMALFRREANALERIGHDSLVKYRTLAFDRTTQLNYLAIEYVDGPALSDLLDGTPAQPAAVAKMLRRLAAGLGAAHEAGVIHRDLSPDNILLPDGRIERAKIIDFGIAKDTNPGEKSVVGEAFAGKFGYAAPEIFGKFKRSIGPWTDVYSLALVVLAFARGRPLDMGITIVDALEARDVVPNLEFLTPELLPVFTSMLQPDPELRSRSMESVIELLDSSMSSSTMPTGGTIPPSTENKAQVPGSDQVSSPASPAFVRASAAAPVAATKPKSRLPLIAGVAATVLLVGVGIYFGVRPDSPDRTESAGSTADPREMATPAAGPTAPVVEWPKVQANALAAISAVPCSDLRIEGTPSNGRIRLAGWHPSNAPIPASVEGWQVDASGVAAVEAPTEGTCAKLKEFKAAFSGLNLPTLKLPGQQEFSLAELRKSSLSPTVDIKLLDRPTGSNLTTLFTIEDRPALGEDKMQAGNFPPFGGAGGAAMNHVPTNAIPARFLFVVVARNVLPAEANTPENFADLQLECAANGCAAVSGWVNYR